jgi:formate hydrogenlyase subunit 6/NADH:ubiquinone oxidoreductase subunit I
MIDYSKCIRCYCCEEMCPHGAVDIRKPALSRILQWRF